MSGELIYVDMEQPASNSSMEAGQTTCTENIVPKEIIENAAAAYTETITENAPEAKMDASTLDSSAVPNLDEIIPKDDIFPEGNLEILACDAEKDEVRFGEAKVNECSMEEAQVKEKNDVKAEKLEEFLEATRDLEDKIEDNSIEQQENLVKSDDPHYEHDIAPMKETLDLENTTELVNSTNELIVVESAIPETCTVREPMDLDECQEPKTQLAAETLIETNANEILSDTKDADLDLLQDSIKYKIDENHTEDVASDDTLNEPMKKDTTEEPVLEESNVETEKECDVTVIEIDDDDDDDVSMTVAESMQMPKEDISTSFVNLENEGKSNEDKTKGTCTNSETMDVVESALAEGTTCEGDVEMKEVIQTSAIAEDKLSSGTVTTPTADIVIHDENNLLEETKATVAIAEPDVAGQLIIEGDTDGDVYYNKECLNYECAREHKQFFRAPLFTLSYFKISKKKFKPQFICATCYDQALDMYEEFSGLLAAKQPLLLKDILGGRQEFVEIIDSSDDEDEGHKTDRFKDNNAFSKDDIKLIEDELENSIRRVLDRVEIQSQLTWSKTILSNRVKSLEAETNFIDAELRSLQKKADNMHVALYQCPKIKVRQLQPVDLNTGRAYTAIDPEISLPPLGEIQRPPIQINETYFAVKNKAIASWVPCKIMEPAENTIVAQKNIRSYKIKFLKSHYQMVKTVSVKHLAYYDPPSVRLPIGSRVIAYFDASSLSRGKEKMMIQSAFYPGIIAEPLKPNNKYRYLIFYDDGYTQYVYHKDVRLVCNVSENVWEDVHPGSRDFIQKYLTQYSINRPMVQTQKGQSMTTESNGKWIYARVVDIDCSLIQMQFEGPKSHTEWIYRGSMRLGPVFKEHQKTMQKTQMPISRLPRRTEPFIRYTEDEEATSSQQQQQEQQQQEQQQQQQNEPRAVAKKSVSRQESSSSTASTPVPTVRHLNNSTIYLEDENKPKGKVVYYTAKRNLPPLTFSPHTCTPACLFKITHNLSAYSPLSKPLLSGWERLIVRQKAKKVVTYRGPCGKIMRNMKELRNYLRATENVLNVDNFDFNHETNCLAEYVIDSAIVQVRDISCGQEKMAIPLVNYYDNTMPPECKYAAQRIPTEGVNLNLDEEFLAGCDCDDDCSDKSKCSCWQLTYTGAKYGNPNTPLEEIGYQYKRLYEHVPTGIYECNPRCKCKSNCLNRVVQHSLEMKLQVFKTSNRGWGLRCINDIPRGSFICVYAGHLLTEDRANEGGLDVGDEYFAELDYIEVAEQIKEGYESDVESAEHEEDDEFYEQEDDDEFTPSKPVSTRSKARAHRAARGNQPQSTDDDSQERQMINFNPNAVMDENSMRESSIRKLYGKDESCYVMDAKITGNLGRYFNHSCLPNLFVQNVLVDTHDLRFPWVAFFASTHIRAGTELTWNYNYEVGVVPGKVLYCQCGAPNCRLRLL